MYPMLIDLTVGSLIDLNLSILSKIKQQRKNTRNAFRYIFIYVSSIENRLNIYVVYMGTA